MQDRNREEDQFSWDTQSILRDIAKAWWLILMIAVSAAMLVYAAVSLRYKPRYTVETIFVVNERKSDGSMTLDVATTNGLAEQVASVLKDNILKKKVRNDLNLQSFNAGIAASVMPESNLLNFSVTADSPQEAFRIHQSYMDNYGELIGNMLPNVMLVVLQQPVISDVPSNQPPVLRYMTLGFVGAAAVLIAVIGVSSYLRDTVKNEEEFKKKIDAELLGTICHEKKKNKKMSMLITNPILSTRYVEDFRMLATRIRSRMERKEAKVLMVTSVAENEGKSTVAVNIAASLAQEGNQVLLMDCDFRKPAVYKILENKGKGQKDLVNVLTGKETSDGVLRRWNNPPMYVAFSYKELPHAADVISAGTLKSLLDVCRKKVDYIIMDTPPMGLVADAEELVKLADAAVLVVSQDKVLACDINDTIDVIDQNGPKLLGCIYGNVRKAIGSSAAAENSSYKTYKK